MDQNAPKIAPNFKTALEALDLQGCLLLISALTERAIILTLEDQKAKVLKGGKKLIRPDTAIIAAG